MMCREHLVKYCAAAFVLSMAFTFSIDLVADQLILQSNDLQAPKLTHKIINAPIIEGKQRLVTAVFSNNVGVKDVILYYRTVGALDYKRILMSKGDGDVYKTLLPEEAVAAPGIQYYIQAYGLAGNSVLHGYSFSPLLVAVNADGSDGEISKNSPGIADSTASSFTLSNTVSEISDTTPLYKNKWLWIGLGVLAAAAASFWFENICSGVNFGQLGL